MKGNNQAKSIIQLSIDTFRLLSPTQQRNCLKNIVFSILQASLEVVSIATVIPLFYLLIDSTAPQNSSFLKSMVAITSSFSWSSILITVVMVFLIKNALALLLTHHQSHFIREISVSFSERLYHRFYQ